MTVVWEVLHPVVEVPAPEAVWEVPLTAAAAAASKVAVRHVLTIVKAALRAGVRAVATAVQTHAAKNVRATRVNRHPIVIHAQRLVSLHALHYVMLHVKLRVEGIARQLVIHVTDYVWMYVTPVVLAVARLLVCRWNMVR